MGEVVDDSDSTAPRRVEQQLVIVIEPHIQHVVAGNPAAGIARRQLRISPGSQLAVLRHGASTILTTVDQ